MQTAATQERAALVRGRVPAYLNSLQKTTRRLP